MSKWQPIATAPKDGTEILLFGCCREKDDYRRYAPDANVGWWDGAWRTRTIDSEVCDATHWMPIPAVPAITVSTTE